VLEQAKDSGKTHKSYEVTFKLSAVEFAEQTSNEKAAKKYQTLSICRGGGLINAGPPTILTYRTYNN